MNTTADFEQLFRDSPYPSMVVANDLTIMQANNAFLRSSDKTEDSLLGRHFFDVFPRNPQEAESTGAEQLTVSMQRAIKPSPPHTVSVLRREDGRVEYLFQSAVDVPTFDAAIQATMPSAGVQQTAPLRARHNLREQMYEAMARILTDEQGHLGNLFSKAPGFVALMIGSRHVLAMVNEAYYDLVGRRVSIGKSVWDALPALAGHGYEKIFGDVYRTGKRWVGHDLSMIVAVEADGTPVERFVDLTCQPYHGIDGGILGIFVQGYDVTAAHMSFLAQAVHRGSEQRLQEGIREARMVVWDWEVETHKLIVSDNINDVLGKTLDSIESLFASFQPRDASKLQVAHQRAIAECGEYREIIRYARPDNGKKLWLDVHGKALARSGDSVHAMRGVIVDITERMEAEEYLHQANRQKDEFLAMLAHELRNPLAPISSAAQLIKLGKLDDTRLNNAVDIITRQVRHMSRLIEDLMDVSRVTRGVIKIDCHPIDVKALVADAVEQASPIITARKHHLSLELCAEAAWVLGDRERLVQVLSNILNNAAKYTVAGGNIVLRLDVDKAHVSITVIDNGIGISGELLPHVFELFTQAERSADRSQGGLGVGLSLVKSLIELHKGKVTAASEGANKGATLTVCLPRFIQDADVVNPGGGKEEVPLTALKIMLVDDNADAALTLAMILELDGHEVIVENNARSALERVKSCTPEVFLIDIGLPEMDGNELTRILRSQPASAHATFIAITGYGQEMDKAKSQQAGFNHHLVKPLELAELKRLLPRNPLANT